MDFKIKFAIALLSISTISCHAQCCKGRDGKDGRDGRDGRDGKDGESCSFSEVQQVIVEKNWKECAWNKIEDGRDYGLIKVKMLPLKISIPPPRHWPWRPTETYRWSLKSELCQIWIFGKIGILSEQKIKKFSDFYLEKWQIWLNVDEKLKSFLIFTLKIVQNSQKSTLSDTPLENK